MDEKTSKVILDYALRFINAPYIWGGQGPGFDCSGLCLELLKACGVVSSKYDTTAQGLFNATTSGAIVKPKAHALSFYGKMGSVTHVAYCLNEFLCIEAGGAGSNCKTIEDAQKLGAFVRIRPIFGRKDYLAVHVPDRSHFP